MKVMISYPPLHGKGSPMLTQNRQFQWYHVPSFIYPLVPGMAATLLKHNGFEVIWNDCIAEGIKYEGFLDIVKREKPGIIAFESKTPVIRQHWRIINELKNILPDTALMLFGDHVTALPQESMSNCNVDYCITGGDYDFTLLEIARLLRKQKDRPVENRLYEQNLPKGVWYRDGLEIKNTGDFQMAHDLNQLPFIDRRLTKAHLYGEKWKKKTPFFYTMAGRDCPWAKCSFCSWTTLYPTFKMRSPGHLLDEIGVLIDDHAAQEIFDDTGTFPGGGWLREFCEGMIDRGYNNKILFSCNMRFDYLKPEVVMLMKRAGFRKIKVGLESANQQTLDRLKKGITVKDIINGCKCACKAGLDIHLTVMVGFPWENRQDVHNTLNLAQRLMSNGDAEMLQATVVVPYPGTSLNREALQEKWFRVEPTDYERFDMREPVLTTPDMEPAEIMAMCQGLYRAFLSPGYIWQRVRKIRRWDQVGYIFKGAKAVIGHLLDFKFRK